MLFHFYNFTLSPGFIIPHLRWAVDSPEHIPTLVRNGLDPVDVALGLLGTEVDVVGAVGVLHHVALDAGDAGQTLVGLQHAAGLVVIYREFPESFGRDYSVQRWRSLKAY